MARAKLKVQAFIDISDNERVLWYEIDESGTVTWHLPKETAQMYKEKMLARMGKTMDWFLKSNPEATLWQSTNS